MIGDFDILIDLAKDMTWECKLQMMSPIKRFVWRIIGRTVYDKLSRKNNVT